MRHVLDRTSPKGEKFQGTCRLCGATNISIYGANSECPNPRGLSPDDAMREAVTGKPKLQQ